MEKIRGVVDFKLADLPNLPQNATTAQVEEWLTQLGNKCDELFDVEFYRNQLQIKGIKSFEGVVVPGAGNLRGHHIVFEQIINRLKALDPAFASLTEGGSPLKVFTHPEHYGAGPNSLHNRAYRIYDAAGEVIGNTKLHPDRIGQFNNPTEMMNTLLDFYDAYPEYADLSKATRAWCVKNGVPFTRRAPSLNSFWPQ